MNSNFWLKSNERENEREREFRVLFARKIKVDELFRFSRVEILIRVNWDHCWKLMEVKW